MESFLAPSGSRVLVGARKGAFILTSDGKRERWDVTGPHFGGWEIYHLKGSPADPNRIYASQSSGWFGQLIQRSNDGGATWESAGNKFVYDGVPGTHRWYDGTPHPWEFKRVWRDRATEIVDSVAGTIERTYDLLDRLTEEITPEGMITYSYDDAGRRASMTVAGQDGRCRTRSTTTRCPAGTGWEGDTSPRGLGRTT